jgi:hypothetical protein
MAPGRRKSQSSARFDFSLHCWLHLHHDTPFNAAKDFSLFIGASLGALAIFGCIFFLVFTAKNP